MNGRIKIFFLMLITFFMVISCSNYRLRQKYKIEPKPASDVPVGPFTQNELELLKKYQDYYSFKQEYTTAEPTSPATQPAVMENNAVPATKTNKETVTPPVTTTEPPTAKATNVQTGKASYYADKFHGRKTASGELYDRNKMTCAHRTLPFGTVCKVTNLANKKSVQVKVNDRGPFSKHRIVDLSYVAFSQLDGISKGVIDVKLEVLR